MLKESVHVLPSLPADLPRGKELVIAAHCAPLSCRTFAQRYAQGHPVLLCCPKREEEMPLAQRMTQALRELQPSGLRVIRMWMPCCGIPELLERIQHNEGMNIPVALSTLSRRGKNRGEGIALLPPPKAGL